ncbi:MAG: RNA 3'-terminal phosphate cyclase [Promethearchaeota archaeon]
MVNGDYLIIDGSMGEGGGSILRLSAGFSVLFRRPIIVKNIRANRTKPGLRLQHMLGLQALRDLTNGTLKGDFVGSTQIKFVPGPISKDHLDIHIRTAGSIALLSQTLQNAAILSESIDKLTINMIGGGTFGLGAPDPYYLNNVTYMYFEKMGYSCKLTDIKDGFYPKGGAAATLVINPIKNPHKDLKPLSLHLGVNNSLAGTIKEKKINIKSISGFIVVSKNLENAKVGERILKSIINNLRKKRVLEDITATSNLNYNSIVKIKIKYINSLNPGVGLSIWANFDNDVIVSSGTLLGKRGLKSEILGEMAVNSLMEQLAPGINMDTYLSDQIIPLLYLYSEFSDYASSEPIEIRVAKVTKHMKTNIDLLNRFKEKKYLLKEEKISLKNGEKKSIWKFSYL